MHLHDLLLRTLGNDLNFIIITWNFIFNPKKTCNQYSISLYPRLYSFYLAKPSRKHIKARETLIHEFAEPLITNDSMWLLAIEYLSCCSTNAHEYIERAVSLQSVDSHRCAGTTKTIKLTGATNIKTSTPLRHQYQSNELYIITTEKPTNC